MCWKQSSSVTPSSLPSLIPDKQRKGHNSRLDISKDNNPKSACSLIFCSLYSVDVYSLGLYILILALCNELCLSINKPVYTTIKTTIYADTFLMLSPEPSASSAWASASSSTPSVPSQHHRDDTQTHPTSCSLPLALDTRYEESALRTPLHALPFPHPKWHVDPDTGKVYEDASVILEICEVDLEDVQPSIESSEEAGAKRKRIFKEEENERSRSKKRKARMTKNAYS